MDECECGESNALFLKKKQVDEQQIKSANYKMQN